MIKKIFYSLLITVVFQTIATAQTVEKGWQRVYIKDVGYFDLPMSFAIQNTKLTAFTDNGKTVKGYATNSFAAIDKNCDSNKSVKKTCAKIALETSISSDGDYRKIDSNIPLTQRELEDLNKLSRKAVTSNTNVNGNVTEWSPLKSTTINGVTCMHYSFKRHFGNQPTEIVQRYCFYNNDRMHDLELSYGISEIRLKNDFLKVLDSFTITNVR